MTEDIITGLSYDNRLFVIARNSTFAYKGQSPDIRAVGRELGVRYVAEGSIRPIGERLRITAQLIETATGTHIWADRIDRPLAEIFDLMDEVVNGLVMALCSSLGVAEGKRAATGPAKGFTGLGAMRAGREQLSVTAHSRNEGVSGKTGPPGNRD